MHRFDDQLPQRRFDNFQFVCFNELKEQYRELERVKSVAAPLTIRRN